MKFWEKVPLNLHMIDKETEHKEDKYSAQGHKGSKWPNWDFNTDSLPPHLLSFSWQAFR